LGDVEKSQEPEEEGGGREGRGERKRGKEGEEGGGKQI